MMKSKVKTMILAIILIIVGILIDQITKYIAKKELYDAVTDQCKSVKVIKDFFYLTYIENTGGAWGKFSGKLWLFIPITVLALGIFTYLMKDFDLKHNTVFSIAMILLFIGAIGNFIDRISRGYVIDFLNFYIFKYDFPVFNFADICLTLGTIALIIDVIFLNGAKRV